MLLKICFADGDSLIAFVRSPPQVDLLRSLGATIAFDAIGGGSLGSDILQCMERAASRTMTTYRRYGLDTFKQIYIYSALDVGPTILNRSFGF